MADVNSSSGGSLSLGDIVKAAQLVEQPEPTFPFKTPGRFGGIDFVVSPYVGRRVQFRRPRSKRRRIQKKWAKRAANYRWESGDTVYFLPKQNMVFCHPRQMAMLRGVI